jgi:hypothetical protein
MQRQPRQSKVVTEVNWDRAAHDLRRSCAKLGRKNGGDLEQIKFLLALGVYDPSICIADHLQIFTTLKPFLTEQHSTSQ